MIDPPPFEELDLDKAFRLINNVPRLVSAAVIALGHLEAEYPTGAQEKVGREKAKAALKTALWSAGIETEDR